MELIFKITANTPATPVEIGDTDFQEHYSGVNRSMAWQEITPAIRQATEKFVIPYIGTELYDDLAEKYNAGDSLSTEQTKTLEYLQDAVAYYTIYHILPEKNAVVASLGVIQNTPTESSGSPTNQWGWKAKRWSALENGDLFLDRLLNYLEKQVTDAVAYFDLWKDSSAYTVKTSSFFRHTDELDEYLNIKGSRRSFLSLIPYLRNVEDDILLPVLCTEQFEALKTATSDEDLALLARVRKVVAYLGLAEAVPHHRIVIDGDGFRIVSQSDQFDDRRNLTNNTHESAINDLRNRAEQKGRQYLNDLRAWMETNKADYPLWTDSDCYSEPLQTGHSIRVSDDEIGGIGIF